MNTTSKLTEEQKAVIGRIFDEFGTKYKVAARAKPELVAPLKNCSNSMIYYHLGQFKKKSKAMRKTSVQRIEPTEVIAAMPVRERLNRCPDCGCRLDNIRNTMRLEDEGKI